MKSNLYKVTEQISIYLKVAKDLNWDTLWQSYKDKSLGYIHGCYDSEFINDKEMTLLCNVVIKVFDK